MREIRTKVLLAVTAVLAGSALAMAVAQTSTGTDGPTPAATDDYYVPSDDYYCSPPSGTGTDDYYCTPTTTGPGGTTTTQTTRTTTTTRTTPRGGGGGGGGNGNGDNKNNKKKKKCKKKKNRDKKKCKKNGGKKDKKVKVGNVKKSGIGDAQLNEDENKIEKRLGDPKKSKGDYLEYKAKGGGKVILGLDGKESEFVGTDSKKAKYRGIEVGDTEESAETELGNDDKKKGDLLLVKKGKSEFVIGLGGGDVEVLGVADKKASDKDIKDFVNKVD
jgi:hypothetical protein